METPTYFTWQGKRLSTRPAQKDPFGRPKCQGCVFRWNLANCPRDAGTRNLLCGEVFSSDPRIWVNAQHQLPVARNEL